MSAKQVEEMMLYLNYIHDSPQKGSVFMIEERGSPNERYHLQEHIKHKIAENFVKSNITGVKRRLIASIIDALIDVGFFHKPKTTKQVSLAVRIIGTFIDVNNDCWKRAYYG